MTKRVLARVSDLSSDEGVDRCRCVVRRYPIGSKLGAEFSARLLSTCIASLREVLGGRMRVTKSSSPAGDDDTACIVYTIE